MNTLQLKAKNVISRIGIAGILFFTIKGFLWMLVPAAVGWFL